MSNNGRLKVIPSVFTIVIDNGKVLLLKRANTGWLDGWYDLPAGHLEDQEHLKEGAARELKEETGLTVNPKKLKLAHVYQNHNTVDKPHYGFIFLAAEWEGSPSITEPDKTTEIKFFPLNQLPEKVTPYVKEGLDHLDSSEVTFSYHAPGSIKN